MKKKDSLANKAINQRIAKNLKRLFEERNFTVSEICKILDKQGEPSIDRSYLSRCVNHPDKYNVPVSFLAACCNYFKISFDNLLSDDFDATELLEKSRFSDIFKESSEAFISNDIKVADESEKNNSAFFIEDPKSPFLKKYLQDYHCYYYSTVSEEHRMEDALLEGNLNIFADNGKIKAELKINTKLLDEKGDPQYKRYTGDVIVSSSVQCFHCILKNNDIGEFCFIIFRYSHLNYENQKCRMAEVLSTSSTPDKRYPVVHRMFLSKDALSKDDLEVLKPNLCLNNSNILISREGLQSLGELGNNYNQIVETLLNNEYQFVYAFKESDIFKKAAQNLSENQSYEFVANMRKFSIADHYNKASRKLDINMWNMIYNKM